MHVVCCLTSKWGSGAPESTRNGALVINDALDGILIGKGVVAAASKCQEPDDIESWVPLFQVNEPIEPETGEYSVLSSASLKSLRNQSPALEICDSQDSQNSGQNSDMI